MVGGARSLCGEYYCVSHTPTVYGAPRIVTAHLKCLLRVPESTVHCVTVDASEHVASTSCDDWMKVQTIVDWA